MTSPAIELYHERHGSGPPLVLLHGAMGTIESCFSSILPLLSESFDVVAVELQGHGHTRDVDRPLTYEAMAADVAALIDRLGIAPTSVVGYSMGGFVGLHLALDRPELVDRLVFAGGAAFDTNALYAEVLDAFHSFNPHEFDGSVWHEAYRRVAPDPEGWLALVTKVNRLDRSAISLPRDRLGGLRIPTLLMVGDADIVPIEHTVELFRLLGGGVPGDLVDLPAARLAVLPGTSHVSLLERDEWVASMIVDFLAPPR